MERYLGSYFGMERDKGILKWFFFFILEKFCYLFLTVFEKWKYLKDRKV